MNVICTAAFVTELGQLMRTDMKDMPTTILNVKSLLPPLSMVAVGMCMKKGLDQTSIEKKAYKDVGIR